MKHAKGMIELSFYSLYSKW